MNDKVSITLEFKDVISFEVNETHVEVKYKHDGGWMLQSFPKEDVKSFYSYEDLED